MREKRIRDMMMRVEPKGRKGSLYARLTLREETFRDARQTFRDAKKSFRDARQTFCDAKKSFCDAGDKSTEKHVRQCCASINSVEYNVVFWMKHRLQSLSPASDSSGIQRHPRFRL